MLLCYDRCHDDDPGCRPHDARVRGPAFASVTVSEAVARDPESGAPVAVATQRDATSYGAKVCTTVVSGMKYVSNVPTTAILPLGSIAMAAGSIAS